MALTNHFDIKAHLFPAAFIVYQLLNLRITDSWRQIMHSDECTTYPILHKLEKKLFISTFITLQLQ